MAPGGRHRRDSGKGGKHAMEADNPGTSSESTASSGPPEPPQLSPTATAQSAAESTTESPHSMEEVYCNCPNGCAIGEPIDPEDPDDAVRVICTNGECTEGTFVHSTCFENWEQHIMNTIFKNNGRARNWTEKQKLQNLWTKRGYDITYRACECRCGHGHLKKDLNYVPPAKNEEDSGSGQIKQKRQKRRANSKQLPVLGRSSGGCGGGCVGSPGSGGHSHGSFIAPRMRCRTLSLGSAAGLRFGHGAGHQAGGESRTPPEGGHPPDHPHSYGSGGHWVKRDRQRSEGAVSNEFFCDQQVKSTGSIFKRRDTISSFYRILPKWKVNGFHIKMEDDCPQGNDDTRIFLLTTLGDHKMREITCLLCTQSMQIYDRYPLIDGTFFLSPVNHAQQGLPVRHEGRDSFLLAACMECLETGSRRLLCLRCGQSGWFLGDRLMLGSLYTYDIISSSPCCPPECRSCHHSLPLPDPMLEQQRHFSAFSEASNCPKCGTRDHHYVRRIDTLKLMDRHEVYAQQNGLVGASVLIAQMA